MAARIAIWDPLPAFRRGIMAILRDVGFDAEAPQDLLAWARDDQEKLLFLSVLTSQDWTILEELKEQQPDALVVALLDDMSLSSHVRALTSGAVAALPRDASPQSIREVFGALLSGRSLMPIAVLRNLLEGTVEQDAATSMKVVYEKPPRDLFPI